MSILTIIGGSGAGHGTHECETRRNLINEVDATRRIRTFIGDHHHKLNRLTYQRIRVIHLFGHGKVRTNRARTDPADIIEIIGVRLIRMTDTDDILVRSRPIHGGGNNQTRQFTIIKASNRPLAGQWVVRAHTRGCRRKGVTTRKDIQQVDVSRPIGTLIDHIDREMDRAANSGPRIIDLFLDLKIGALGTDRHIASIIRSIGICLITLENVRAI